MGVRLDEQSIVPKKQWEGNEGIKLKVIFIFIFLTIYLLVSLLIKLIIFIANKYY